MYLSVELSKKEYFFSAKKKQIMGMKIIELFVYVSPN